jgi:hypothetical protein
MSVSEVILFKLIGVYHPLLAPGYLRDTKRSSQLQCKYIHRTMHIVVITVTVVFVVQQLSVFMRTILVIRVVVFQFIHAMIRHFGSWACIIFCIVLCKLFATATSLKKEGAVD